MIAFHIHLLLDLIGSKGPDGYEWPIEYLYPFNREISLVWAGQWELNSWQNEVFGGILIGMCVYIAIKHRQSPIEVISSRIDKEFFRMVGG